MFRFERWLPLRQVEDAGGAGGAADTGVETGGAPPIPSGPGSGRSELRQQLEKNFETDRKVTEKAEKAATRGKAPRRVAGGAEIPEPAAAEAGAEGTPAPVEGEGTPQGELKPVAAPEGLSPEVKAAWGEIPPPVQAAIAKRLDDSAKGVAELKAKYGEMDQALAPHMESIRRHGHTPAKAVGQLFAWFQALSTNPRIAFPALAQSFGFDPSQVMGAAPAQPQPGQQQPQPGQQPAAANGQDAAGNALPPEVQKYINDLQAKLAGLEQTFTQKFTGVENALTQQTMTKTNEIIAMWAKDKPHYEQVRGLMAQYLQSGAVPLKDGQVDLDAAYDMAIWGSPEIRAQVLKQQQDDAAKAAAAKAAAEKKAQQEQADKARRASVSISGAAPGAPGAPGAKPGVKKKTVRESIMDARAELEER